VLSAISAMVRFTHQKSAVRVHRDVALAADNLLVGVVTAGLRGRRLDRLAVDDGGREACLALGTLVVHHQGHVVDGAEQRQPREAPEPPHRLPGPKSVGSIRLSPALRTM
jgi:hypothetical protein